MKMRAILLAASIWGAAAGLFSASSCSVEDPEDQESQNDESEFAPTEDAPIDRVQLALQAVPDISPVTDGCDTSKPTQSLASYAAECAAAMDGVAIPGFKCDEGTDVEEGNESGAYPFGTCDRPNVLNHACDPDSRFQVIPTGNANIAMVAHCRKHGLGAGKYGDVALIAYNKTTGSTCFFQALGDLNQEAPAPSVGASYWKSPAGTAADKCVTCHDTGPFIRTPYLARMDQDPVAVANGDVVFGAGNYTAGWNKTMPYKFVGADFQTWKAFSVKLSNQPTCTQCHRMGMSALNATIPLNVGTAQNIGLISTAKTQAGRNAGVHPWMPIPTGPWNAASDTLSNNIGLCAQDWRKYILDPVSNPAPPAFCTVAKYAVGDTCKQGITGVINPNPVATNDPVHIETPTDFCGPGVANCPMGIPYYYGLSGPFYIDSGPGTLYPNAGWRGSMVRWELDGNGYYKHVIDSYPTGLSNATRSPSVSWGAILAKNIANVPSPDTNCNHSWQFVEDLSGNNSVQDVVVGAKATSLVTLSGLIGNVAQANIGGSVTAPDWLSLNDNGSNVRISQQHQPIAAGPLMKGPLRGEARRMYCNPGWLPNYLVKNLKITANDQQILASPSSKKAICFISGLEGAWSSTRDLGLTVPEAKIYTKTNGNMHMLISPTSGADKVAAYVSCVQVL